MSKTRFYKNNKKPKKRFLNIFYVYRLPDFT